MPLEMSFSSDGKDFTPPEFIWPGDGIGVAGQDEALVIKARKGNDGGDIFSVPLDMASEHLDDLNELTKEENQVDVVPENGEVVRALTTPNGHDSFVKIRHIAKLAIQPFRVVGPS